jgi:hypothetical protein
MKATVDIGYRAVTIEYSIYENSRIPMEFDSSKGVLIPANGVDCGDWEMFQKNSNSRKIQCKQTLYFNDSDEWKSIQLLDGRIIDFHYDYESRSEFANKKDWGSYIFQGYEYTDGKPQMYDEQIVDSVKIVM